jgi:conjugative transfer region protein TrbK
MRWLSLQTIGVVGVAILTVLILALDFREHATVTPSAASRPNALSSLETELQRCQALGKAATDDAACTKVWAENRRRFFGSDLGAVAKTNTSLKNEARRP